MKIDCGRVSAIHMNVYRNKKEVVAVSDINLKKAKVFANKYRDGNVFANYTDLLEIKDLDT